MVIVIAVLCVGGAMLRRTDRHGDVPSRFSEARLAGEVEHQPPRTKHAPDAAEILLRSNAARTLSRQWQNDRNVAIGRKAGAAWLMAGEPGAAYAQLRDVLQHVSGERDLLAAIRACHDSALLTDFSAAALHRRNDPRELLLAIEAASRALELARTPTAAWNRALASTRLGVPAAARAEWRNVAVLESSQGWRREAAERRAAAERAAASRVDSPEFFFHRDLIANIAAGRPVVDLLAGDRLASDTAESISRMHGGERHHLRSALAAYVSGQRSFNEDRLEEACSTFATAEAELEAIGVPLVLLVRDHRIRCECSQGRPNCLASIRAYRTLLAERKRYPWLAARAAYAEGQTLYRQGRIFEAADRFQQSQRGFRAVQDSASEGLTHSVLANTYAMAGETEPALVHYLAAVRLRFNYAGDRRRIQLEDAMMFLLRHGYVATAALLLDELAASPASDAARAMEATLRAVIFVRRGNAADAKRLFERAHELLARIRDPVAHAEVRRSVVMAEAGCGLATSGSMVVDIEAAVTADQQEENSIWLPQVLTERGAALEARNETARAETDYLRAVAILEHREPRLDQTILTLGAGTERESPFDRAIQLYLRQGRSTAALSVAQRSTSVRISSLHARAAGMRNVFRSGDKGPHAVAELQAVLPPGHAAVAQHLLRDSLITWIVTRNEITSVRRGVPARQLIGAVDELRDCARHRRCGAQLQFVSDLLLRGWIEQVPRGTTLWIQPPAELQAVPFAMLTTRHGERLLVRNGMALAPGFSTFVRAARLDARRNGDTTALFAAAPGPPDLRRLPQAAREVARGARVYHGAVVDTEAQRSSVLGRAGTFALIHFAGHALVNDEQPLLSALAFNDGLLYIHELDGTAFANARMVVLSGCSTGRSPRPTMSIANALLSQGVPSVVYTLWPVDDDAAAAFAVEFHHGIAAGKSRAGALQQAALSLLKKYPERPDWWAAFALAGASGPMV